MLLWVGLGNPEAGMQQHRHNIGFMAVEHIAARHGFSPWRNRFKGEFSEGQLGGQKVFLLKPMTYMNRSGQSVQQAAAFYKIPLGDIFIFHDELDLDPGRIKVKSGGGAAGHNGLRSIDQEMGGQDYWRIRLGIGHPGHKDRVTGHVLGNFSTAERPDLEKELNAIADSASLLAQGQKEAFMSRVALLLQEK
ncbi:aminoacyl-tRNA hydrolase [Entomobacter blattae]|uniref:Peptidyl-tRNA hydrolase n=1 Tax=Entomobacter blattae TaxID=2762277 RepID=A0A7H1NQ95_9PROT|nr:aminoacyl-tRNA hydrolase [Entomobacter blattae]QNT77955.1 Peptidyl-tRNA hydrolase [Entomobacter blattae]